MSHFRFGFIPHARVFAFRTKKNKNPIAFEVWRFLTQKIWPWKLRERRRVLFLSIEPNRRFWFFSPLHFCIQLYCSMWIAHLAYLHLLNPNCALQTCTLFWCHLRVMYSCMQRARFDRGSMYIPFLSSWLQSPTRFWRANLVKTKRSQCRDYVSFKIRKLEVNLLTRLLSIFIHEPTSMTAHGLDGHDWPLIQASLISIDLQELVPSFLKSIQPFRVYISSEFHCQASIKRHTTRTTPSTATSCCCCCCCDISTCLEAGV